MTIEELKNSDKLDLYMLGLLPENELQEVEDLLVEHPELLTETNKDKDALAAYGNAFSKQPAPALKTRVMAEIEALSKAENASSDNANNGTIGSNIYKIAASILLLVSVGLSYMLVQKNSRINDLSDKLAAADIRMAENNSQYTSMKLTMNSLYSNDMQQVKLKSTDTTKTMFATIFYNKADKKIMVQQGNLEKRNDGMQYQLWALVDGKPYSAGVFDAEDAEGAMKEMTTDMNPQLFAVSIEKRGGAESPTPERIILISDKIL